MEVIIQPSRQQASTLGARLVARLVRKKPSAVLGLATGSTPLELYRDLVRLHREDNLDFHAVTTFNLDEYLSLSPTHPASYHHFMQENLFRHLNIREDNTHIPDGRAQDVPASCTAYEHAIKEAGGIDLQILGIGGDGHIGFNEPSSSLASRTRIKSLTQRTRQDNARYFSTEDEIPRHVITMGVGTIMESREIVLLAFGAGKAEAVAAAVEGPITASVPASVLQLHERTTVLLDEAAAANLRRGEYYRWVFENKPAWQEI